MIRIEETMNGDITNRVIFGTNGDVKNEQPTVDGLQTTSIILYSY